MNPQPEEDLQHRLEKLEAEINTSSEVVPQPQEPKQTSQSSANFNLYLERFQSWFNSLSGTKKWIVSGVAVVIGFAMLQAVFKLVVSVISLALLAVLMYVGYKFFVSSNFQRK
ncbi:hypothetical protein [aff. Roholtiella sp. LEGE 12411]|uniref:hypothetical protein n=1 Tax=aff. Roholtiella sp. LEGE 12411 TaxID=1828822 RepID=UPI001880BE0D|nr:hypothetical protein [aff. Roholtiella sp. LEGE 12411]MBE9038080.1 hypothetical protein [aff. Roholtiella sp. LEGE 12411]